MGDDAEKLKHAMERVAQLRLDLRNAEHDKQRYEVEATNARNRAENVRKDYAKAVEALNELLEEPL